MLKNELTLKELMQIMKYHLESNSGKIGSFEVNAESIQFSGTLMSNVLSILSIILSVYIS